MPPGVNMTRIRASASPMFCRPCRVPRGMKTKEPTSAWSSSSSARNRNRPSSTIRFYRELHIDEIREESDVAVARTHTTGTLTPVATNAAVPLGSRELFVLRRTGADWKITDYMFNRPEGS